jgi:hypothetical protein
MAIMRKSRITLGYIAVSQYLFRYPFQESQRGSPAWTAHTCMLLSFGRAIVGNCKACRRLYCAATTVHERKMTQVDNNLGSSLDGLPDEVFHYTSIDAMMKIVDARSIWCTAIPYLNDSKERTFLFDAVRKRLPILQSKDTSIDPKLGLQTLEVEDVGALTSFAEEVFVGCFAESRDSLMHWRAYCPQETGVAIGFRSACLKEACIAEKPQEGMSVPPVSFGRVGYLSAEDTTRIDDIIYKAYARAKDMVAKPHSWGVLNDHFRWAVDSFACANKLKAFEIEGELRLLTYLRYREKNIRFRTVRSTLIPYVKMTVPSQSGAGFDLDFDKKKPWNAIQSVMIGPTANMALTKRSVEAFFALQGMDVRVVESNVPYRDW